MFDLHSPRPDTRTVPTIEPRRDDFARRCREPAEQWMLARRRWRPAPAGTNLPRVVAF